MKKKKLLPQSWGNAWGEWACQPIILPHWYNLLFFSVILNADLWVEIRWTDKEMKEELVTVPNNFSWKKSLCRFIKMGLAVF